MSKIRRLFEKVRRSLDPLRGLDEHAWLTRVRGLAPAAVAVVEPAVARRL